MTIGLSTTTAASTLASTVMWSTLGGPSVGMSENIDIDETDELKLLNFPPQQEDLLTAVPLTAIFGLLLITGFVGNVCTAIVIVRPSNKYMHTPTNCYLFSLAISDLLFLVLGLPHEMYALWHRYPYPFSEFTCIARSYVSEACTNASILTICAFTIERYVAICHPFYSHSMSRLPRAIASIIIVWLVAAISAVPFAIGLGIVKERGPITGRILESSAQCATKRLLYANMFEVSAICFFIVPMFVVTVLYILIGLELRRAAPQLAAFNATINRPSDASCHEQQTVGLASGCCVQKQSSSSAILHHKQHISQRKVIRMLVAVVVSFFACWLPFQAQRLLASYLSTHSDALPSSPFLMDAFLKLTYISAITYYLSSTINPLLYQLMSEKFRLAFKETFACCSFTNKAATTLNSNSTSISTSTSQNTSCVIFGCLSRVFCCCRDGGKHKSNGLSDNKSRKTNAASAAAAAALVHNNHTYTTNNITNSSTDNTSNLQNNCRLHNNKQHQHRYHYEASYNTCCFSWIPGASKFVAKCRCSICIPMLVNNNLSPRNSTA